jgi:hypothetical protein
MERQPIKKFLSSQELNATNDVNYSHLQCNTSLEVLNLKLRITVVSKGLIPSYEDEDKDSFLVVSSMLQSNW